MISQHCLNTQQHKDTVISQHCMNTQQYKDSVISQHCMNTQQHKDTVISQHYMNSATQGFSDNPTLPEHTATRAFSDLQLHHCWHYFFRWSWVQCSVCAVSGLMRDPTFRHCQDIFPFIVALVLPPQSWVLFTVVFFVGESIFSQCRYPAEPIFVQICQVLGVYFVKDW